jgi:hypothetical protein
VLEFELVEELVTMFRDQGGRTWTTEALVLDAGALPASARHALTVAGAPPGRDRAALLVRLRRGQPPSRRPHLGRGPVRVPFVAPRALSLVGTRDGAPASGHGDTTYVGILIAFGALDFVARREGARLRFRRRHLPAWGAALFAVGLAAWPMLRVGYLTAFAGRSTSTVYVSRATWMQGTACWWCRPARRPTTEGVGRTTTSSPGSGRGTSTLSPSRAA